MNTYKIITAAVTAVTLTFAAAGTSFAGQGCARVQGGQGNGFAVNYSQSRAQPDYAQPGTFQSISAPAAPGQGVGAPNHAEPAVDGAGTEMDDEEDDEDEFGEDVAGFGDRDDIDDEDDEDEDGFDDVADDEDDDDEDEDDDENAV